MKQSEIIFNAIKQLAKILFISRDVRAYLYGSRARGDASVDSDWDLLIIANDAINEDFEQLAFPFAEIGWKHGAQITPLLYTKSEWEAGRGTAFYDNVKTEAILL